MSNQPRPRPGGASKPDLGKDNDNGVIGREQMRIIFAAMFECCEIVSIRVPIESWPTNEELSLRALRRADMLLHMQERTPGGDT